MRVDPIFQRVFRQVYGNPCWGVQNCLGSDIVFEFGKPHLEIREPRSASPKASKRVREFFATRGVHVHGDWHLWIWMCDWEVFKSGKRLGSNRSRSRLEWAVQKLNGQKLVGFSIHGNGTCTFKFDLGGVLVTQPFDRDGDQWILYCPEKKVLTLRGADKYSFRPSNTPDEATPWRPVVTRRK